MPFCPVACFICITFHYPPMLVTLYTLLSWSNDGTTTMAVCSLAAGHFRSDWTKTDAQTRCRVSKRKQQQQRTARHYIYIYGSALRSVLYFQLMCLSWNKTSATQATVGRVASSNCNSVTNYVETAITWVKWMKRKTIFVWRGETKR